MTNIIIIIILVALLAYGVRETIKHFRGEGACCGGGTAKARRKKLKNKIVCTCRLRVSDMHCQNCVNAITETINDIDGAAARVSLRTKTVTVMCDREIEPEVILYAIRKRGYDVTRIE